MSRFIACSSTILITAAMLAGCPGREVAEVTPQQNIQDGPNIPVEINRDLDILFVIDDSMSMEEEQDSLVRNFPEFISVLEGIEGGLPNVHLGVVSTDVGVGPNTILGCDRDGDNGTLQSAAVGTKQGANPGERIDCTPSDAPMGAFIEDIQIDETTRMTNYDGNLEDTFSCIAELGIDGCGFEQPLEAMYRALNGTNPANRDFLRPNAFLAVIIISDEDDCSTEDTRMFSTADNDIDSPLGPLSSFRCFEFGVQCDPDDPRRPGVRENCRPRDGSPYMYDIDKYVRFLKEDLEKDPANIVVAGIIGDTEPVQVEIDNSNNVAKPVLRPSCVTANGEAAPGVRLASFLGEFSQRNTIQPICEEDLSQALTLIAQLLAKVIGSPCIQSNIDANQECSGGQAVLTLDPGDYECVVSDVHFPRTEAQTEEVIPECATPAPGAPENTERPCWRLEVDTDQCGEVPNQVKLEVYRNADPSSGTEVQGRCVVHPIKEC